MATKTRAVRLLVATFAACFAAGCATLHESPFASPQPAPHPQESRLLRDALGIADYTAFKVDGHLHTVQFVGTLASLDPARAHRLSCYAQAPDAISRYNAVPVAIWGVVTPRYRSQILNGLHSLHGGDGAAIVRRRARLDALIRQSIKDEHNDMQTGFLIHALGDSYAHVHQQRGATVAYGEAFGHGFALRDPDEIFTDDNYLKYVAYTLALFDALTTGDNTAGRQRLVLFNEQIGVMARKHAEYRPDLVKVIIGEAGSTVDPTSCSELYDRVADAEVKVFLAGLMEVLKR